MAFDVSTAQPVKTTKFDVSTAKDFEPVNEKSFIQGVSDFFTGNDRATPNTENLPEIGQGGLLFGEDKGKAALITPALLSATDPEEMAKILQSNFENVGIVRDQNGNVFAANNNNGARVVLNKPGLSKIDFIQGLGIASLFSPAGAVQGSLRVAGAAGITSAAIEGAQEVSGGDFSPEQVAFDTVGAGVLSKAVDTIASGAIKNLPSNIVQAGKSAVANVNAAKEFSAPMLRKAAEEVFSIQTPFKKRITEKSQ